MMNLKYKIITAITVSSFIIAGILIFNQQNTQLLDSEKILTYAAEEQIDTFDLLAQL